MRKLSHFFAVTVVIAVSSAGCSAKASCDLLKPNNNKSLLLKFATSPKQLLAMFPRGGTPMQYFVSELIVSDAANTPRVTYLVLLANADQRHAMAKGLRLVADICGARDVELGRRIVREVLRVDSPAFVQEYNASDNLGDDPAGVPAVASTGPSRGKNAAQSVQGFGDPALPLDFNAAIIADPFAPLDVR